MEFFTRIAMGIVATYAITWSIAIDDSEGPFRLYQFIRWFLGRPYIPPLIRENKDCPYCTSFWSGFLIAVVISLTLPYEGFIRWCACVFLMTYAFHGGVVFWFRWLKITYGISSRDS